jgi:dihydrolipoamide dehydrogenase
MSERYDLCILGAGPAGIAAAARAHGLGKRVALVEAVRPGGAGIADGALSSKTLWHLAMDFVRARRTDRGWHGGALELAWPEVAAQVRAACEEAWHITDRQLAHLAAPSERGGVVERIAGKGRFVARDVVAVDDGRGGEPRTLAADHFLVAVGSKPRTLPGIDVDGERILTSDHVERGRALPPSLGIVGAGVVGCEYATIFAGFGATAVEIFDRGPRILPFEDADVSAEIAASFVRGGIHIHAQAKLEELVVDGDGVRLKARIGEGGEVLERRLSRALLAVGRVPALDGLGLELAGVNLSKGGVVCAAAGMARTSAPHVWAAGDVSADVMLANVAEQEGRHAVEDMFGLAPPPICYEAQSAIYFFRPEVAAVGLNEQLCAARKQPYRAAVVRLGLLRRATAMRAIDGFVKLLAAPDGKLLGLRVVGPQASSCIQGVALLIEQGGKLADLDQCLHPHPAVTEGVQECARLLLGTSAFAPTAFPELVRVIEAP